MSKGIKKLSFVVLAITFLFSSHIGFAKSLELSPSERDLLKDLGIESLDEILTSEKLIVTPKKQIKKKTKKKIAKKPIQNKKPTRAPADLTKPKPAKEKEKETEVLADFISLDAVLAAMEKEFFIEEAVASVKKPLSNKVEKNKGNRIIAYSKKQGKTPITNSTVIEVPVIRNANLPSLIYKENSTQKNFNYADASLVNYVSATEPVAKKEKEIFQSWHNDSPVRSAPVRLAAAAPVQIEKEQPKEIAVTLPAPVQTPEQKQEIFQLKRELKQNEDKLSKPKTSEAETKRVLDEYKRLLNLDKQKESASIQVQTQPDSIKSRDIISKAPVQLTAHEQKKQESVIESLAKLIQNPKLQKEKPMMVYNEIIDEIMVPKLKEATKQKDEKIAKKILAAHRFVPDTKDYQVTKKVHETHYKNADKEFKATISSALDLVNNALTAVISDDFTQATDLLEKSLVLINEETKFYAKAKKWGPRELLERALNDKDSTLSDDQRFVALKVLFSIMEKDSSIHVAPKEMKEIKVFVQNYLESLTNKKDASTEDLADLSEAEQAQCKIEKIREDMKKIQKITQHIAEIKDSIDPNATKEEINARREMLIAVQNKSNEIISHLDAKLKEAMAQDMRAQAPVLPGQMGVVVPMNAFKFSQESRQVREIAQQCGEACRQVLEELAQPLERFENGDESEDMSISSEDSDIAEFSVSTSDPK